MKYIILTPVAFIPVTSAACSLLSHKFRIAQLKANPFLTECLGCQDRSAQSRPCDAMPRGTAMLSLPWEPCGRDTAPPVGAPEVHPSPRSCRTLSLRNRRISKLFLLFPCSLLSSRAPAAQEWGLVCHSEPIHHPEHRLGHFFHSSPVAFNFCLSTCMTTFVTSKPLQRSSEAGPEAVPESWSPQPERKMCGSICMGWVFPALSTTGLGQAGRQSAASPAVCSTGKHLPKPA